MSSEAAFSNRLQKLETRVETHATWATDKAEVFANHLDATAKRIDRLDELVNGGPGFSLRTRVKILWAAHHWFLALAGLVLGGALTTLLIHWLE